MFEEFNFNRVGKLDAYNPKILDYFSYFLNVDSDLIITPRLFAGLEVSKIDDYTYSVTYLNVNLLFQLFLGYEADRVVGRVACIRKYKFADEIRYDVLGEFTFNLSGNTNLEDNEGNRLSITDDLNRIVAGYLDKAITERPKAFIQK